MRWPALSTAAEDGAPTVRTIVLRKFCCETRTATFWTDRRSTKYAELDRDPRCSLLFFHPGERLQIRAMGAGRPDTDPARRKAAFAQASRRGLEAYSSRQPPGTTIPTRDFEQDPALAEKTFVSIHVTIDWMEAVQIGPESSWRARLDWRDGREHAWLVP